jgi:hypothetical protein
MAAPQVSASPDAPNPGWICDDLDRMPLASDFGGWLVVIALVVLTSIGVSYLLPTRPDDEDVPRFFRGNEALGDLRYWLTLLIVFGTAIAYMVLGGGVGLVVGLAIAVPIALVSLRSARRWRRHR